MGIGTFNTPLSAHVAPIRTVFGRSHHKNRTPKVLIWLAAAACSMRLDFGDDDEHGSEDQK